MALEACNALVLSSLSDDKIDSSLIGNFNPGQSSNGVTNWIIRDCALWLCN